MYAQRNKGMYSVGNFLTCPITEEEYSEILKYCAEYKVDEEHYIIYIDELNSKLSNEIKAKYAQKVINYYKETSGLELHTLINKVHTLEHLIRNLKKLQSYIP